MKRPGTLFFVFKQRTVCAVILVCLTVSLTLSTSQDMKKVADVNAGPIPLPAVQSTGLLSVEEALKKRASVREFRREPLTLDEVGQLLWVAQGVNRPGGYRTAPSAGALYPLEIILVAGRVQDINPGVYRYLPRQHALDPLAEGDVRPALAAAALDQDCVANGATVLVITAIYERTTVKYGQRGIRYVHVEVGHAAQNIYLQATALGLGTVAVGAFQDDRVQELLNLPGNEHPLLIMPVGKQQGER